MTTHGDDQAGRLVATVLQQARAGTVSDRALEGVADPAVRGAVTTGLEAAVAAALTAVWRRGWQPADLGREAGRRLPAELHEPLVAGVRQELATYARATVDPAWWGQVDELEEDLAARRRRRRWRAADDGDDPVARWRAGCGRRAAVAAFVERLAPLQLIGPVPGEARHTVVDAPDVDDKLLTKVRRLLAQAEGTPYEAEAETFTAAAQSLMARHRIDRAMLEEADQDGARRGPGAVRLSVERPYEQPKAHLLSVVAAANRCRAVWSQELGFVTVLGHQVDRDAVEVLFTSLLVQGTAAMRREGDRRPARSRTRGFRSSFLSGFAVRIGQRLEEASTAAEDEATAELEGGTGVGAPGGGPPAVGSVALVLRRRDEEVEELLAELFPVTRRSRARRVSDHAGFLQGRAAADRADLGVGGRLGGRVS